jgi:N6-adenosine-specific RNA methylase IME4
VDDGVIFLWYTSCHLENALALLQGWGFRYVDQMTWVKMNKANTKPIGCPGHYLRHCSESMLLGVKGSH